MHLPEIDRYAHINSIFSRWDPRWKIVSLSVLITSFAFLPSPGLCVAGLIFALGMVYLARLPLTFVWKQAKWVVFFVTVICAIASFTAPGEKALVGGIFRISPNGIAASTVVALRAVSIYLVLLVMIATTRFHITLKALESLRVPHRLIQLTHFSYRYIFTIMDEVQTMLRAAALRAFRQKTDLYTVRTLANLVGMLFVRGFERTERVYRAMVSRGYSGTITVQAEFRTTALDVLKAGIIAVTAILFNMKGIGA